MQVRKYPGAHDATGSAAGRPYVGLPGADVYNDQKGKIDDPGIPDS